MSSPIRIDLLVAIMLDAPPRFPTIRPVQPIEPPPQLHGLIQIPDSPLYGHCQLQDVLQDSPFCSRSIAILQHMQALTRTYLGSTSTGTTGALELLPIVFSELDIVPTSSPHSLGRLLVSSPPSLLTIISLAATLYTRLFETLLLPVSVSSLTSALVSSIECVDHDEIWMRYPGILLWIVLTGCVSTPGEEGERSYFLLWATRIGLSSVWGWWDEMRRSLEVFALVRKGKKI